MTTGNPGILDGARRIGAKIRDLVIDGGLPGAPLGLRIRGATQSGAPPAGTWKAGDVTGDRTGRFQICTGGGNGAAATWAATVRLGGDTMQGWLAPAVATLADGSSVPLNAALGNDFRWSLGGTAHTLAAPSSPVNGQAITIAIKYGGSYTPLFNSVFDFGAAGQPSWSATSGKTDYCGFRFDSALNGGAGEWAYMGSVLGLTS